MIIDCISDLHGHYPELEGGDLLIIAGDLPANNHSLSCWDDFFNWLDDYSDKYKKTVIIAGNHDNNLEICSNRFTYFRREEKISYLEDSGTEFYSSPKATKTDSGKIILDPVEKYKIWGSPWTETFQGMNPHCKAFTTNSDDHLHDIWIETIPDDVDILITHAAPFGILDSIQYNSGKIKYCGSDALLNVVKKLKPKLHIFGHIHEGYGKYSNSSTLFINASIVNEHYEPVNKPIRVIL